MPPKLNKQWVLLGNQGGMKVGRSHQEFGYPDWGDSTISIYYNFDRSLIPHYEHRTCIMYSKIQEKSVQIVNESDLKFPKAKFYMNCDMNSNLVVTPDPDC